MIQEKTDYFPLESLRRELSEFRLTASPLSPGFSLSRLFAEVTSCRIIKENERRQVYYLQAPGGGYFLKRSTMVRGKDRRRHLFLPFRKWSEWRNLHRLWHAKISTARPLLRGQRKDSHPQAFFILTKKIPGKPLQFNSLSDARNMGEYTALLHSRGIYHADLNCNNIILTPQGQFYLIDVQEVFFLPLMPRWLKVHNLGNVVFSSCSMDEPKQWPQEFLDGYIKESADHIVVSELMRAARHHQKRRFRSRAKRCCKNTVRFEVVKTQDLRGYKRRDFTWDVRQLNSAIEKGRTLKPGRVIVYQSVCIKQHHKKFPHKDRCLVSWKMSVVLEACGISVPRSLGYYVVKGRSYFLSEYLVGSVHLNDYLSALTSEKEKRLQLKKLAMLLKKCHDRNIWQRDFKSSNILCQNGNYLMVDLDGVKKRQISEEKKIINIAQLNASVSNAITLKDRLRFFHYYSSAHHLTRQQRRVVYRKVWDFTKTKNTFRFDLDFEKLLL